MLFEYNKQSYIRSDKMVIHFEKLSRAIDAFNSTRVEEEQVSFAEIVSEIKDPLDELEVLRLIVELLLEATEDMYKVQD